jgi:rhodanese-related sulfurtransferase
VLKHYIRKARSEEEKEEQKHPHTASNDELQAKLNDDVTVIDVREPAEYAFGHIPGAVSMPLGELEALAENLDKTKETFIICRTGSRSDLAAQKLTENGFTNVINVIPGMSKWEGPTA